MQYFFMIKKSKNLNSLLSIPMIFVLKILQIFNHKVSFIHFIGLCQHFLMNQFLLISMMKISCQLNL